MYIYTALSWFEEVKPFEGEAKDTSTKESTRSRVEVLKIFLFLDQA